MILQRTSDLPGLARKKLRPRVTAGGPLIISTLPHFRCRPGEPKPVVAGPVGVNVGLRYKHGHGFLYAGGACRRLT